jgi:hypothetical protein
MTRDASEVLEEIRDLAVNAVTIEGRLSMRDHIKHLLEREGLWQK